jgi:MoaA/NifB/PqqE/SkfB family radical SAM enzyme
MSTGRAVELIEQIGRSGTLKLGFSGGECLVHEGIDQLLECSSRSGLVTSISTNGREVPKHIDAIGKYVDILHVSMDGPPEIHDRMRGKGSYKMVIEAIKAAQEAGVKVVTNTVLSSETVNQMPYIVDLAKKMNFNVLFQPVFNYNLSADQATIDSYKPEREKLKKTIEYLINEKKRGGPIGNSFALLRYMSEKWPNGRLKRCFAGCLFATLAPDGRVMPCLFVEGDGNWPNAAELGFNEAFQLSEGREIVSNCRGCYCSAYIEASMIFKLNPWACFNALTMLS